MYRLMVVEDEAMIRQGIVKSIPWQTLGFIVVAESSNGKDALSKLKKNPVDVLLTDIKMPIMGGIELAKNARKMYPDIEIIILSGFSEFEYARQAISFRAFDYLLKPTNKKKLLEAFAALKLSMDQKRERQEEIFSSNIYINAGYETMRNEFLKSLLEGNSGLFLDFDEKTASLELDFSGELFTVAMIKFDRKSIHEILESAWETDKRLLTFSYSNIIKEVLCGVENAYFFVERYDTIFVIFCFSSKERQELQMVPALGNICENIQSCLFKQNEVGYTIGIGLSYPSIHHITKSYHQAKKAIQNNFYLGEQKIQVYEENNDSQYEQNFIQYYPEEMKKAAFLISGGNYVEAKTCLTSIFQYLMEQNLLPEIVKNYCITLKFMVQAKFANGFVGIDKVLGEEYSDFVKEALTVKELKHYVIQVMTTLAKEIDEAVDSSEIKEQSVIIEKSKLYIAEHLSEKITLRMISEHVYLSETYFSFLFKKVTGITYIDYIQDIRMKEAKKLLVDTTYKIYKIAERIGYKDYKYFSIQFKKYVGMTPKEYRNLQR